MNVQTVVNQRYDRGDIENVLRMLYVSYPRCFFEDARLRRPLKRNIAADLQVDGFAVAPELTIAAINWYENRLGYQRQIQAGSRRIDLTGSEVSTVTEREALDAQKRVQEINAFRNARAAPSPVRILREMHADGLISDCAVKKLDAPTMSLPRRTAATPPAPEFAQLYDALAAANAALAGISDPDLRAAVARAALDVMVKKVQQATTDLRDGHKLSVI
jgi:sRNA-binding protein